ncbi:MAG: flagellar basal body P-ring protein FlgI [Pseudomonadota bacterium]
MTKTIHFCLAISTALAVWAAGFAALFASAPAAASSRIKDIVDVEHVRENQLIGYGLVVGLDGTGDRIQNSPFTEQALEAMLERLGINIRDAEQLRTQNLAAVTVTADLGAFARAGSRIDVTVSAMGDSRSLRGGTLLATPLLGLDGEVYAVAQGPLAMSAFDARGQAASVTRGVTNSARIAAGAIVEREIGFRLADASTLTLALKNPDFSTARRISGSINAAYPGAAQALDPATVELALPAGFAGSMVDLVGDVERLSVAIDSPARVVVDATSGTVVMGADVRVSPVAIAQGQLTIRVTERPVVSQPGPFNRGGGARTAVVPRTRVDVDDGAGRALATIDGSASLRDLVDGLNRLGVAPRDLVSILQALKAAGAMQADIVVI